MEKIISDMWVVVLGFLACLVVFTPTELLWPLRKQPYFFRPVWKADLAHFFITDVVSRFLIFFLISSLIQGITYPQFFANFRAVVGAQPMWLQFIEAVVIGDFIQYWMHRWAHEVPFLWRFHAVHHGAEHLDWLASVRIHPVDQVIRRVATVGGLLVLGLSEKSFLIYWLVISPAHAIFLHANFRPSIPYLRQVITTPEFHHWHHAQDPVDKNYAGRFPIFDRLFNTMHMPDGQMPASYGCSVEISPTYFGQFFHPFQMLYRQWQTGSGGENEQLTPDASIQEVSAEQRSATEAIR